MITGLRSTIDGKIAEDNAGVVDGVDEYVVARRGFVDAAIDDRIVGRRDHEHRPETSSGSKRRCLISPRSGTQGSHLFVDVGRNDDDKSARIEQQLQPAVGNITRTDQQAAAARRHRQRAADSPSHQSRRSSVVTPPM